MLISIKINHYSILTMKKRKHGHMSRYENERRFCLEYFYVIFTHSFILTGTILLLQLKINKLTLKDKRLGDKIWMTDICGRDFIYGTFWQMARFSTDITWHQHKPRRVYNNIAWLNWISIELIFLHRQRVATKALNRFNIVQYKNDWCAPTIGAPRVMMIFVLSKTIGVFCTVSGDDDDEWWIL